MTLTQIVDRTGISMRRVRYVLDHAILPGTTRTSRGRGTPRSFTDLEAFAIACAALMLEAGLRKSVVKSCLQALCRAHSPGKPPRTGILLNRALHVGKDVKLSVADGVNFCLEGKQKLSGSDLQTGWLQMATAAPLARSYVPMVRITLDVGRIRTNLFGKN